MVPAMTVDKFERFFRAAAGLDVDKNDLKRYSDFVNRKIYDLLIRGKAAATENGRDIIQPSDLPITKGLEESIHQFRKLDEEIELSARPHLHHHRPRAEEPPDQALGAGIPDFRSAAVDRSGSQLWLPRSSGVWRALTTGITGPAAVESFPATTRLP